LAKLVDASTFTTVIVSHFCVAVFFNWLKFFCFVFFCANLKSTKGGTLILKAWVNNWLEYSRDKAIPRILSNLNSTNECIPILFHCPSIIWSLHLNLINYLFLVHCWSDVNNNNCSLEFNKWVKKLWLFHFNCCKKWNTFTFTIIC